ncbi:hypothetical protein DPEC_G00335350 [Dallia pectoralis]|uniref:Uncharacterized protein n=1 Tax=Dallia pectoralis TaxID=75939 RepID=A0ACC2F6Y2_DALPE|nr:hypothetical protein DPEC_G00335350 [Dallia pectoralis]
MPLLLVSRAARLSPPSLNPRVELSPESFAVPPRGRHRPYLAGFALRFGDKTLSTRVDGGEEVFDVGGLPQAPLRCSRRPLIKRVIKGPRADQS